MRIVVTIEDTASLPLEQLGRYGAATVLRKAMATTGAKYRDFVRRAYLSGQMLHRRQGMLWRSMRVRRLRDRENAYLITGQPRLANIYHHYPDITIRPTRAKVLRFEQDGKVIFTRKPITLRPRPFISESAAVFDFSSAFTRSANLEIDRELKRRGLR